MLVLDDRTLRAAGLDYATAVALLAPAEHETVVHVRQELDGGAPPLPHQGGLDGFSSLLTPGCAADCGYAAGQCGDSALADEPGHPHAEVLAGQEYEPGRRLRNGAHAIESHAMSIAAPATITADEMPPRRPAIAPSSDADFRGVSFGEAERLAKDQRLSLVMVGGVYTLMTNYGQQRHYPALADAVQALRLRRY